MEGIVWVLSVEEEIPPFLSVSDGHRDTAGGFQFCILQWGTAQGSPVLLNKGLKWPSPSTLNASAQNSFLHEEL